jgi:hypothetical protein
MSHTTSPLRLLARAGFLLWELPQNALGVLNLALVALAGGVRRIESSDERLMVELEPVGNPVSLGLFVFYGVKDSSRYVPFGRENRDHEYGHSIQSRWLGPLYLVVVGLPSTLRVVYAVAYRELVGRRRDRRAPGTQPLAANAATSCANASRSHTPRVAAASELARAPRCARHRHATRSLTCFTRSGSPVFATPRWGAGGRDGARARCP